MSNNPYKVLGVSPDADDETIKGAYRELARKYHPDRYANSDLADLAKEKMQEINAAYEEIRRMRAEGAPRQDAYGNEGRAEDAPRGGYGYENRGTGNPHAGDGTEYEAGNYRAQNYSAEARAAFTEIRNAINAGDIERSEHLLDGIADADRGAEWHFLTGCVQMRKGFYVDAQRSFDTAYRMEPTNNEYWTFKEKMHAKAKSFGGGYDTASGGGCSGCDICSSLLCADCCCECMGGDLIPCC